MLKPEFTGQFKRDYKLAVKRGCNPNVKRRFAIRTGDGLKSPEIRMAATLLQTRDARTPAVTTLCRCLA